MVAKGIGALSALPNKKRPRGEKDESRTSNESKRRY